MNPKDIGGNAEERQTQGLSNSIPAYGHCTSFTPLLEHTGVWHSLQMYGFLCFWKFYYTVIVKGVIALNVVCLKRWMQELLGKLFRLDP